MLIAEAFHLRCQPIRFGSRQILEATDADLHQHLPATGTDAAHLTEMTL